MAAAGPGPAPAPVRLSEVEAAAVARLHEWRATRLRTAEMSEHDAAFLARHDTLARYAVAHNGDTAAATRGLEATLAWRRAQVKRPSTCPGCEEDFGAHCFVPLGLTEPAAAVAADAAAGGAGGAGSADTGAGAIDAEVAALGPLPIVYASQPRARDADIDRQMSHMVHTLEHVFEAAPHSARWLWIVDFNGFGLREALAARVGINTVSVFSAHMPERMGRIVLLNAPGVFSMFFGALKPFVDARTMAKIVFVSAAPAEVAGKLAPFGVPARLGEWIGRASGMDAVSGNLPLLPSSALRFQIPRVAERHGPSRYAEAAVAAAGEGKGADEAALTPGPPSTG